MAIIKIATILTIFLFISATLQEEIYDIKMVEIEEYIPTTEEDDSNTTSSTTTTQQETTSQPPVTPPWQAYMTRLNILNINESYFNATKDLPFRESVAKYSTAYCNSSANLCQSVSIVSLNENNVTVTETPPNFSFTSDDVVIERRDEVNGNLQIGYYVVLENDLKLPRDVADAVVTTYAAEISQDVNINFEVIIDEEVTTEVPPATTEGEPVVIPGGGTTLEPWAIALITLACFLVVCAAGYAGYRAYKSKKSSSVDTFDLRSRQKDPEYQSLHNRHDRGISQYEAVNRVSIADEPTEGTSTFNNPSYDNTAFEMTENDSRR